MKKRKLLDRLPGDFDEIRLWKKRRHSVRVRVLDPDEPKDTRWATQLPLQRACAIGWRGLDGFDDDAAARGDWHNFEVLGRSKVRRFLKAVAPLLRRGLIALRVDGRAVTLSQPGAALRPTAARRRTERNARAIESSARDSRAIAPERSATSRRA